MTPLERIDFDAKACERELADFKSWLDAKNEYSESKEIQPFFRARRHLSAFIASYNRRVHQINRIKFEFPMHDLYIPDLVVGDYENKAYVFVEFEDAKEGSIFSGGNSDNRNWSGRWEKGFSQLVDWFWTFDQQMTDSTREHMFGGTRVNVLGLLVIGRDEFIKGKYERERFELRRENVIVNSKSIICVTFDELFYDLNGKFNLLRPTIEESIISSDPDAPPLGI